MLYWGSLVPPARAMPVIFLDHLYNSPDRHTGNADATLWVVNFANLTLQLSVGA